jgi:aspartyl-tRNA(Asn)/glutamyl-tRNA(Gln) amidotransferase subunit C
MEINNELIDKLATLSKLEFDEQSREEMKKNLTKILAMVSKIDELNLDNIEPLKYMTDERNILREDVVTSTLTKEEILLNAPQKDSDYIKVPKVMK